MTKDRKESSPGEPAPASSRVADGQAGGNSNENAPVSWVDRMANVVERWVPDALSTAIAMMVALVVLSLGLGSGFEETVKAYYDGLWMFLKFTMQMTLILVLSLVVCASPVFKEWIARLSQLPGNRWQVVTLAALCTGLVSYLNWGLGLALGPIIAIHFCRQAERKGIAIDFLFLLAVGAGAGSIWQFGLSASAPLVMADPNQELVPGVAEMPLSTTIWSVASIAHVTLFMVGTIVAGCWLMPRKPRQISEFEDALQVADVVVKTGEAEILDRMPITPAIRIEKSSWVLFPLCFMLVSWLWYHFFVAGMSVDINSVNTSLLLLGLLLHRNVNNFQQALKDAVCLSWPIIVLYHIYAGVAGLIQFTPVGEFLVGLIGPISTPYSFPFLVAAISSVVAIFIPTSGGQWAIQGYVTSTAAEAIGVTPQRALLALSIGDHMGNLLTPFWAVVGAQIARVDFRLFFGYRLIFAALWFVIGVLCFTFLPC